MDNQLESFSTEEEEDDLTLVKNEANISDSSELSSFDSCGPEMFGAKSTKIDECISETSVGSEGLSIDSCESNIFGCEAIGMESCSSENSLLAESEVGMQLESFLTEEDDDLTLAGM